MIQDVLLVIVGLLVEKLVMMDALLVIPLDNVSDPLVNLVMFSKQEQGYVWNATISAIHAKNPMWTNVQEVLVMDQIEIP